MGLRACDKYQDYKRNVSVSLYAQRRGHYGVATVHYDISKMELDHYFDLIEAELLRKYPILATAKDTHDREKP